LWELVPGPGPFSICIGSTNPFISEIPQSLEFWFNKSIVINHVNGRKRKHVIVSIDIEKAFDQLDKNFYFYSVLF
jgi:hypothetical protein